MGVGRGCVAHVYREVQSTERPWAHPADIRMCGIHISMAYICLYTRVHTYLYTLPAHFYTLALAPVPGVIYWRRHRRSSAATAGPGRPTSTGHAANRHVCRHVARSMARSRGWVEGLGYIHLWVVVVKKPLRIVVPVCRHVCRTCV